jgi:hypothetical protein
MISASLFSWILASEYALLVELYQLTPSNQRWGHTASLASTTRAHGHTAGQQRGQSISQGRYRKYANPGSCPPGPARSPAHQATTSSPHISSRTRRDTRRVTHFILIHLVALPLLVEPRVTSLLLDKVPNVHVLPGYPFVGERGRVGRGDEGFEEERCVSRFPCPRGPVRASASGRREGKLRGVPCDEDVGPVAS